MTRTIQSKENPLLEQLQRTLVRLEVALEGGPWLLGEQFTITDICIAPVLHRIEEMGMSALWKADMPRVTDWYRRIKARPSFALAFYPEALLAHYFPQLRELPA